MYKHKWTNWHPWIDLKPKEMFCCNCHAVRGERLGAADCPGKFLGMKEGKPFYVPPDEAADSWLAQYDDGDEE